MGSPPAWQRVAGFTLLMPAPLSPPPTPAAAATYRARQQGAHDPHRSAVPHPPSVWVPQLLQGPPPPGSRYPHLPSVGGSRRCRGQLSSARARAHLARGGCGGEGVTTPSPVSATPSLAGALQGYRPFAPTSSLPGRCSGGHARRCGTTRAASAHARTGGGGWGSEEGG